MKRLPAWLAIGALLAGTAGCGPPSAATPTQTLTPLNFATNTPPTTEVMSTSTAELPAGTPISFDGVSLVIPTGLGTAAATERVPEAAPDPNGAPWDVHPEYTQFSLQGYPLEDKFFEPQINVYPAELFAQMHEGAAATITTLQTLLASPNNPTPTQLPFLPLFNAGQLFEAQPQVRPFQNGSGIRYLTEFAQYPDTVNNKDLFYTFQGLTSDGKYYISAILPVNAAFLAPDENPDSPVPPDGIPFDPNAVQQYYAAAVQKLNATAPDAFTPSLAQLDALVQSISVTGNP